MPVHYREWDTCPYCHKRLGDVRMGVASRNTLGPPLARCPHCSGVYKTGKSEWAAKSKKERAIYYILALRWCLGAALVAGVCGFGSILIMSFANLAEGQANWIAAVVTTIVSAIGVAWALYSVRSEIKESLERTRKAKQANPGE